MESEKSSIEILKSFARKDNWEFSASEKKISKRHGHTVRKVILQKNSTYFISEQTANENKYRLYSGIFIPVSKNNSFRLVLRKRDILDKLQFRKNKIRFKIGNSLFDSNVLIETNNDLETHKLLSSGKIQHEVLNFLNSQERLHIGVNEINPRLEDETSNKNFLSVFITMEWMYNADIITRSLKMAEMLSSKIK